MEVLLTAVEVSSRATRVKKGHVSQAGQGFCGGDYLDFISCSSGDFAHLACGDTGASKDNDTII